MYLPNNINKIKSYKPTLACIRKKLFNWLKIDLSNLICLDAFSCTGLLGFEAASNGCKLSILLEKNKKFFLNLLKNKKRLNIKNIKIFNYNFFKYIKYYNRYYYDLVFIDSPYIKLNFLRKSLNLISKYLRKGSLIYLETIFNFNFLKIDFLNLKILKNDFFNKINFFLIKVL